MDQTFAPEGGEGDPIVQSRASRFEGSAFLILESSELSLLPIDILIDRFQELTPGQDEGSRSKKFQKQHHPAKQIHSE